MCENNINTNVKNSYYKYNRIRTKLLLFIDNEIQSKIKRNNKNLKFNCEDEIKISFEETFTQKKTNKYDFHSSNVLKIKKNDILDKSLSTIDISPNKNTKKSYRNGKVNTRSKTLNKEDNCTNNIFCFKKKLYSIKNLQKQSSTFLILSKQRNEAEYLKIYAII